MTGPEEGEGQPIELRRIQPYQARKDYVCPGCNQAIRAGTGHLVAVPAGSPELRRHWHPACWAHRHRRRPGPG